MAHIKGAVYVPPSADLPLVAVVFGPDGEVLAARVVPSIAAGERLIMETVEAASFQRRVK